MPHAKQEGTSDQRRPHRIRHPCLTQHQLQDAVEYVDINEKGHGVGVPCVRMYTIDDVEKLQESFSRAYTLCTDSARTPGGH